jgi:hypothetical protein
MSSQIATYEDANLLLRLYELRREDRLREARAWFETHFKPKSFEEASQLAPQGSEQNAYVRMVTSYWDMVASLITSGVLNEELFFESGHEMVLCWERVRDVTPKIRELFHNPLYLANLEEACARFQKHLDKHAPGAYGAMATVMRS